MKTVMVSGNFDPFHYGHLDYIKQSSKLGELECVVSSDHQVKQKKGGVNEPAIDRVEILDLVLKGLGVKYGIGVNVWDNTTMVALALSVIRPDIFCRGSDKTIDDMPPEEKKVCDELGIEVVHVKGKQVHGSDFV